MDFFDEINAIKYLFLLNLEEPEQNRLLITIKGATISEQEEYINIGDKKLGPARRINMDGPGKEYEIYFDTYAAYCVTNESFPIYKNNEESMGRVLCIYTKSAYFDYIRNNTIVEHIRDGELKHYRILCQNHIIDIAAMEEPTIKRIE